MATFAEQVKAFADKTNEKTNLIVKKIVVDIGTRLVLRSPVGDPSYWVSPPPAGYVGGRFRANWQYGLDAADTKTSEEIDKTGATTISRVTGEVPSEAVGHVHYITNSLPYSMRLENGWSRQAPHGMVALTEEEFTPIVREAAAQLK